MRLSWQTSDQSCNFPHLSNFLTQTCGKGMGKKLKYNSLLIQNDFEIQQVKML